MLSINTKDTAPIWKQIEEGMRRMISLGVLEPGSTVPSVRELAQQLRVNPNTVARAYQRLTDTGVFVTRRGEGTFVSDQPAEMEESERVRVLREAAGRYAGTALALGVSLKDAAAVLENCFAELDPYRSVKDD